MRKLTILLALLLTLAVAAIAQADGPVIWKQHCPRHHDVAMVADNAGDGVHVLCILSALEAETP